MTQPASPVAAVSPALRREIVAAAWPRLTRDGMPVREWWEIRPPHDALVHRLTYNALVDFVGHA